MKIRNKILLATATLVAAFFVNTSSAQYRAVGSDCIAASPKVRAQIEERNRAQAATIPTPNSHSCCQSASIMQGCKAGCCAK